MARPYLVEWLHGFYIDTHYGWPDNPVNVRSNIANRKPLGYEVDDIFYRDQPIPTEKYFAQGGAFRLNIGNDLLFQYPDSAEEHSETLDPLHEDRQAQRKENVDVLLIDAPGLLFKPGILKHGFEPKEEDVPAEPLALNAEQVFVLFRDFLVDRVIKEYFLGGTELMYLVVAFDQPTRTSVAKHAKWNKSYADSGTMYTPEFPVLRPDAQSTLGGWSRYMGFIRDRNNRQLLVDYVLDRLAEWLSDGSATGIPAGLTVVLTNHTVWGVRLFRGGEELDAPGDLVRIEDEATGEAEFLLFAWAARLNRWSGHNLNMEIWSNDKDDALTMALQLALSNDYNAAEDCLWVKLYGVMHPWPNPLIECVKLLDATVNGWNWVQQSKIPARSLVSGEQLVHTIIAARALSNNSDYSEALVVPVSQTSVMSMSYTTWLYLALYFLPMVVNNKPYRTLVRNDGTIDKETAAVLARVFTEYKLRPSNLYPTLKHRKTAGLSDMLRVVSSNRSLIASNALAWDTLAHQVSLAWISRAQKLAADYSKIGPFIEYVDKQHVLEFRKGRAYSRGLWYGLQRIFQTDRSPDKERARITEFMKSLVIALPVQWSQIEISDSASAFYESLRRVLPVFDAVYKIVSGKPVGRRVFSNTVSGALKDSVLGSGPRFTDDDMDSKIANTREWLHRQVIVMFQEMRVSQFAKMAWSEFLYKKLARVFEWVQPLQHENNRMDAWFTRAAYAQTHYLAGFGGSHEQRVRFNVWRQNTAWGPDATDGTLWQVSGWTLNGYVKSPIVRRYPKPWTNTPVDPAIKVQYVFDPVPMDAVSNAVAVSDGQVWLRPDPDSPYFRGGTRLFWRIQTVPEMNPFTPPAAHWTQLERKDEWGDQHLLDFLQDTMYYSEKPSYTRMVYLRDTEDGRWYFTMVYEDPPEEQNLVSEIRENMQYDWDTYWSYIFEKTWSRKDWVWWWNTVYVSQHSKFRNPLSPKLSAEEEQRVAAMNAWLTILDEPNVNANTEHTENTGAGDIDTRYRTQWAMHLYDQPLRDYNSSAAVRAHNQYGSLSAVNFYTESLHFKENKTSTGVWRLVSVWDLVGGKHNAVIQDVTDVEDRLQKWQGAPVPREEEGPDLAYLPMPNFWENGHYVDTLHDFVPSKHESRWEIVAFVNKDTGEPEILYPVEDVKWGVVHSPIGAIAFPWALFGARWNAIDASWDLVAVQLDRLVLTTRRLRRYAASLLVEAMGADIDLVDAGSDYSEYASRVELDMRERIMGLPQGYILGSGVERAISQWTEQRRGVISEKIIGEDETLLLVYENTDTIMMAWTCYMHRNGFFAQVAKGGEEEGGEFWEFIIQWLNDIYSRGEALFVS